MAATSACGAAFACASSNVQASAQSSARVDAAYPFSSPFSVSSLTVQSQGGVDHAAVALGAGGGILVLSGVDGSSPNPQLFHPGTSGGNPDGLALRALGRVHHQRLLDDWLWAACGSRGIMRYDFSASPEANPPPFDATYASLGGDVRDLAVVSHASLRRVFAGSIEANGQGKLWMIDPLAATTTSIALGAGIECVEAYAYTPASGAAKLRVIVGTRCAGTQLFEIDAPYTQLPSAPKSVIGGTASYVRDLQLHVIDAQTQRVYAALHQMTNSTKYGVYAYRIDADGNLVSYSGNGWPIRPFDGVDNVFTDRLALDPARSRLVIGFGTKVDNETNYSGPCDRPVTCNCDSGPPHTTSCELPPTLGGVIAYTIGAEPSAAVGAFEASFDFPVSSPAVLMACRDVAIRPIDDTHYWIDVAADGEGYQALKATRLGANWSIATAATYAQQAGLPLHSWDTLLSQDGMLYVGAEVALVTIDPALPLPATPFVGATAAVLQPSEGDALEEYADYDAVGSAAAAEDGGVLGLSGVGGGAARVYAASNGGVRIFDTSGAHASNPVMVKKVLNTGGKAFFCAAADALSCPPIVNANDRFLYVSHISDDSAIASASGQKSGGVALYNVRHFGGNAPRGEPDTSCPEIARYIHDQHAGNPMASLGGLAVAQAVDAGAPVHYVFVAYGPKSASAGGESHIGIVVLRTHCATGGWALDYVTKVRADSGAPGPCLECVHPGVVTYDPTSPGHPRVYVAFFCNGIAVYDVSDPAAPVLEGWRPPTPSSDETFFQILRGSLDTTVTPNRHRLVVSSLTRGLGVVSDLTNLGTSTVIDYQSLPVTAAQIQYADESRNSFWVAGFRDGLLRATLQFP